MPPKSFLVFLFLAFVSILSSQVESLEGAGDPRGEGDFFTYAPNVKIENGIEPDSTILASLPAIPDQPGLIFDPTSCAPFNATFALVLRGLRRYVLAAIRTSRQPDEPGFKYWFLPEMSGIVYETLLRINASLYSEGPQVVIRCLDSTWTIDCDPSRNNHPLETNLIYFMTRPEFFTNICPVVMTMLKPQIDPCKVPEHPSSLTRRPRVSSSELQTGIRKWERWMDSNQSLVDVVLSSLVTAPMLSGRPHILEPQYLILPEGYQSSRGVHKLIYELGKQPNTWANGTWDARDFINSWWLMAKDAIGRSEWLRIERKGLREACKAKLQRQKDEKLQKMKQDYLALKRSRRKKKLAVRPNVTAGERPGLNEAQKTRDELRRSRRLTLILPGYQTEEKDNQRD
ncbi:MAG: hypothetical protein M1814_006615 [Vezdaea aestivalis]|nr:MAG: hypothetical protein M1814_006615 [Vezdaea aestivalis]